jgi:hypothetical protein
VEHNPAILQQAFVMVNLSVSVQLAHARRASLYALQILRAKDSAALDEGTLIDWRAAAGRADVMGRYGE